MEGTPFGRYQLLELLGRGGMGEVWRAHDPTMGRTVALKVLPPNFADDEVFQERFRREARAAAGLDEPHVVPVYDFGEINGRLYVTMRLIKGRDLQVLLEDGPLEPARALGIVEQIAYALDAAHQIGLVHRDVKPSNILVGEHDFAYLIDFGIARAAGETGLTSTGATIGTWAYMSPERLNTGHADAHADIYALACVLHEAVTGQRPFPGDSLEQQIVGHLTKPPPRPSALRAGVPESLDEVISTGMAKDPEQRYASTRDLAQAARAALAAPGRPAALSTPSAPSTPPAAPIVVPPPAADHPAAAARTEAVPHVSLGHASTHLAPFPPSPAVQAPPGVPYGTGAPKVPSRRRLQTQPPASWMRRLLATLIDILPISVICAIGFGIGISTAREECDSWTYPADYVHWKDCYTVMPSTGDDAIYVAAFVALVFGVWNWIYRRSRKGSTIGQSVLKFTWRDADSGRPPGFRLSRLIAVVLPLLIVLGGQTFAARWWAHITVWHGSHETCYNSNTGVTTVYPDAICY